MPEISLIIPVYNAEKYLKRCLDSVIKTLFKIKAEVLLIDNNSKDQSLKILKDYAKKYPKLIKVLQCDTPGAAAVRNFGVKKAKGEYLWFIDADDEVVEDAASKLLEKANSVQADLVMFGMKRIYLDGTTNYLSAVKPDEKNFKSRFIRYGMGPVQVLVKRMWWLKNEFAFLEGVIHEDMELMSSLILYTDKYEAIDEPLYLYYQNKDSVLHKTSFDAHIFDIFPALKGLYKRFQKANAVSLYHDELEWFFIWNLLIDSAGDFSKFKEGQPGFKRSRTMLKKYFPNWRRNKFLKQKPLKLRIRVLLNYYK